MNKSRFFLFFISLMFVMFGLSACGGGGGGGDGGGDVGGGDVAANESEATITGKVAGTTIIAVNAEDEVIASVEAVGLEGNKTFTLSGLPTNEEISIFLMTKGALVPMVFDGASKDTFTFSDSGSLELGFITVVEGIAQPTIDPVSSGSVTVSSTVKRASVPQKTIQKSLVNNTILGRSVDSLVEGGKGAMRSRWAEGANAYFQQANIRATGTEDKNKTRLLYSLSRIFALVTNTATSDSDTTTETKLETVGDFLSRFGCTELHLGFDQGVNCPSDTDMPSDSPNVSDINTFMGGSLADEIKASLALLNEIGSDFTPIIWAGFDMDNDGWVSTTETWEEWTDTNKNSVVDVGEISSASTSSWIDGVHLETMEMDYGDVLVLKGILQYQLAQLAFNQANNLTLDLDELSSLDTMQQVLDNNESFGTQASNASTHLQSAKTYLSDMVDTLLEAMTVIQAEVDDQTDDFFELDAEAITDAKNSLNDFKASLSVSTTFTNTGGDSSTTLNFSKLFGGSGINLRGLLPPISGDDFSGLFPDQTLGGVLVNGTLNGATTGFGLNSDLYPANGIPDMLDDERIWMVAREEGVGYYLWVQIKDTSSEMGDSTYLSSITLSETFLSQWSVSSDFSYSPMEGQWNGWFTTTVVPTFPLDVTLTLTHKTGTVSTINVSLSKLDWSGQYPSGNTTSTSTTPDDTSTVNTAPTASDGTLSIGSSSSASGTLSASDSDGDALIYSLVDNGSQGTAAIDTATGVYTYTSNSDTTGTDTFTFVVSDGKATSNVATVTVTIADANTNTAPEVSAGVDQTVNENDTVILTGSASDTDGSIASYFWSSLTNVDFSISNSSEATATFTAPLVSSQQTLIFKLLVTDNEGLTQADTVNVTVNPVPRTLSIDDVTVTEGDSGSQNAIFTVSLNMAAAQSASVEYTTSSNGNITPDIDYIPVSSTVSIDAGASSTSLSITVYGDTQDEPEETFTIILSNAFNATISDGSGIGTIIDDDPEPTVSFTSSTSTVEEGATASITMELSLVSGLDVSVPYTLSGTASTGDYSTTSDTTITIPAGSTSTLFTYSITSDSVTDDGETLIFSMGTPTYATLGSTTTHTVTLNDIPPPAQVSKTGQTVSYASGDDGDLEKGIAWPDPRFTINSDGTITDNLTDLIWLANANCFGQRDWTTALTDANSLANGSCGLTDGTVAGNWRLPSFRELESLIDAERSSPALLQSYPFTDVQSANYWSGTTSSSNTDNAWFVDLNDGDVNHNLSKSSGSAYVWPVRGGE